MPDPSNFLPSKEGLMPAPGSEVQFTVGRETWQLEQLVLWWQELESDHTVSLSGGGESGILTPTLLKPRPL